MPYGDKNVLQIQSDVNDFANARALDGFRQLCVGQVCSKERRGIHTWLWPCKIFGIREIVMSLEKGLHERLDPS